MRASLTLIVPGMARQLATPGSALHACWLAHLAARGSLRYAWDRSDLASGALYAWQRGLLWALQLTVPGHPSAALTALASDLAGDGDWLHADPVHLAASLSHLSLIELAGELQLSSQHSAACEPVVREHLRACGFELHVLDSGRWLIQTPRRLDLVSFCPAAAAGNELQRAMPQGGDAAALRRLMTELQMLLHEHPVNQHRAQQGLPAANSIWLWGSGRTEPCRQPLPLAFGSDDYLRGLYRCYAARLQPAPTCSDELLAGLPDNKVPAVALLEPQTPSGLEQHWLAPLIQALRARRLTRLDLLLDSWHLSIDRRGLRRFWRRPLPPESWTA